MTVVQVGEREQRPDGSFIARVVFEEGVEYEVTVADPVSAGTVASLLAEYRVPMAVWNACQSAMQTASEAGLAQQLVQTGCRSRWGWPTW